MPPRNCRSAPFLLLLAVVFTAALFSFTPTLDAQTHNVLGEFSTTST
jgi:hypothetical protein